MSDYIFPGFIAKALKRPSVRTQLEANLVGLTFIMLTGVFTPVYMIFFTQISVFYKILSGIGGIGVFLLLGSNLVTTYAQYYYLKQSLGLYPVDERLYQKVDEAKNLINELNYLIKQNEVQNVQSIQEKN